MLNAFAKSLLSPLWNPVKHRIQSHARQALAEPLGAMRAELDALSAEVKKMRYSTFSPDPSLDPISESAPFFQYANCQAADFYHPRYIQLCKLIGERPRFHRKQWEWIYVLHQLLSAGVVQRGARGLVFGVGREPLPAVFAAMDVDITATDAPLDMPTTASWAGTDQHSAGVEGLFYPSLAPEQKMRRHVTHAWCDMRSIDDAFTGYDFNWSSCCLEHLGSLEAGMEFVVNAVEKTLRMGGVAVHTTEFNASSNDRTVTEGGTVLYRRRDLEALVGRLRDRGHLVEDFKIGPTAHALDFHVDVPPYSGDVHLKLLLAGHVATSVGIVVRRGR